MRLAENYEWQYVAGAFMFFLHLCLQLFLQRTQAHPDQVSYK